MPQVARDQIDGLTAAMQTHDYLRRIVREIAQLHRVVFHGNKRADWSLVHRSAEQILIAEIVSRYHGQVDRLYYTLRSREDGGRTWEAAISEIAGSIHSYFTTPLGIVMRQDMFGSEVVFFTPDAYDWTAQQKGGQEAGKRETS